MTEKGIFTHVLNDHYYPPVIFDRQTWNYMCCYEKLPANEEDVENW